MKTYLLRGVPNSVRMDGWWMSEPPKLARRKRAGTDPMMPRLVALFALIIAGDALMWGAEAGLSLVLFGMLVLLALWLLAGRRGTGGLALAALLFLPLAEKAQALSLGFFFAGMVLGAAWIGLGGWLGVSRLMTAGLRFMGSAPGEGIDAISEMGRAGLERAHLRSPQVLVRQWFLPVALGTVFALLLVSANPMLEVWLDRLAHLRPANQLGLRLLFWAGLTLFVMPFLVAMRVKERLKLGYTARQRNLPATFNAEAVCRSLLLFNAMFAVQTFLDLIVLWGGRGLPQGMSYAEYAHRGAYPLILTALLAGFFAVLARPFTDGSKLLRRLLLAWVAQTVFLVISSLYRLDLYVSAYGLTHLRLAAGIWMGIVALGLTLVIWQVLKGKPASWLMGRAALLGVMALYGASFLSFSATVARYNLTHDVPLDLLQICSLGPQAMPAILEYQAERGLICAGPIPTKTESLDWREWGFRDWRLQRSLAALQGEAL